jgi:hypothetical protein
MVSDPGAKASAYNLVLQMVGAKHTRLHHHLTQLPATDDNGPLSIEDSYMAPMFGSLLTEQLSVDEAARLWDVFVFEGDTVLVRAAAALLLRNEVRVLGTQTAKELRKMLCATSAISTPTPGSDSTTMDHVDEDAWMRSVQQAGKV